MNDNFGSISQDFLPPGYGEIPGKVIQPVSADAPTLEAVENPDDYDGWLKDLFKKGDASEAAAAPATAEEPVGEEEDVEKRAFLQNLGDLFKRKDKEGSTRASALGVPAPDSRDCKAKGYSYRQYADGKVKILDGPSGKGTSHTSGKTWSAMTSDIESVCGPYPGGSSSSGSFWASLLGGGKAGGSASVEERTGRGAAVGAGIGAAAVQLLPALASILGPQEITEYDDESTDVAPSSGPSMGLIIGGVAIVGILGVGIMLMLRDDDDEE